MTDDEYDDYCESTHRSAYRAGLAGAAPLTTTADDRAARAQALAAYDAECAEEQCPECCEWFPRHPDGPRQCPSCIAYLYPY